MVEKWSIEIGWRFSSTEIDYHPKFFANGVKSFDIST